MPNSQPNIAPKKWYKVWWKALLGFFSVVGVAYGILEAVYLFTEWHYKEQQKDKKIEQLEKTLLQVINEDKQKDEEIKKLKDYVDTKKKSYAVGFRVFKQYDSETAISTDKKMYRDWDGIWHEVHLDHHYTQVYGIDYYYYIDKNNGEKIYCW